MKDEHQTDSQTEVLKKTFIALKRAEARVAELEKRKAEPIAIVGMACRLPGGANDPDTYWEMLRDGVDTCGPIPEARWEMDRFYAENSDAPGRTNATHAHFLDVPVDAFDAPFFGMSAKEAQSLDPQQRLLLEVTWEALENAGIDPNTLRGSDTGIFTGISSDDYAQAHRHSGQLDLIDGYALTGTCFAPAAGRVSYTFGFEGPSFAVDTACSSSLVVTHLACQSLRDGETSLAIASGVNLILSPVYHIASTKLGTISPDGRCKTFDASANGYGRGEGCGVVVLKRLSDAQRDGDQILATIRGTAVNQDGRSNGLTAPSGLAQERVIRSALDNAGLQPAEIGYIECHGTGTSLGDPIEVEAIGRVMKGARDDADPVVLSTAKANIGHLEAAAGVAGLIKAVQVLRHGEIPGHIHLDNPNPHVPWGKYPFEVRKERSTWSSEAPRRAGISSFGFSGTNAHVIVEAAPHVAPSSAAAADAMILPLSARSSAALKSLAATWHDWLDTPRPQLADAVAKAASGRSQMSHRLAVVGSDADSLRSALARVASAPDFAAAAPPKVTMMFTGQGSQYVGMGRDLYAREPVFRSVVDACDAVLTPLIGRSIVDVIYGAEATPEQITRTEFTQPALFVIELALCRLWQSWGITVDAVCGHSIGEYTAAHVAGVMSLEDALKIVAARGRLMQSLPDGGAMAAVFADEATVLSHVPMGETLSVAAVNTFDQTVISGDGVAVSAALTTLEAAGVSGQSLSVSHAFHSPLMRPIVSAFQDVVASCTLSAPQIPFVSTVTGARLDTAEITDPTYWANQIEAPVRFAAAARALHDDGTTLFIEAGPSPVLTGMVRQTVSIEGATVTGALAPSRPDTRAVLLEGLAQIFASGVDINWTAVSGPRPVTPVALPAYPFQRQSYYLPPIVEGSGAPIQTAATHAYLGQAIRSPALPADTVLHQAVFTADMPEFLKEHQIYDRIISPGAAHLSMGLAATRLGDGPQAVEDISFTAPLVVQEDTPRIVQLSLTGRADKSYKLVSQAADDPDGPWTVHSEGRVTMPDGAAEKMDLDGVRSRCDGQIEHREFYDLIETLGYKTGPGFQCVREIAMGNDEALCRVEPAQVIDPTAIYPGLIDSMLQCMLPACKTYTDEMRETKAVLIPLHIGRLQIWGDLNQPLYCHAQAVPGPDVVKGQIMAYDADGNAVAEIRDFILKKTDNSVLYQELNQDVKGLLFDVDWQAMERPAQTTGADKAWVIVSDGAAWGAAIGEHLIAQGAAVTIVSDLAPDGLWTRVMDGIGDGETRILFAPDVTGSGEVRAQTTLWSLLSLARAAGTDQRADRLSLWMLSTQSQHVVPEDQWGFAIEPAGAALWGFGRAIATEFPGLWGGLIDVEYAVSPAGVDAVIGAMQQSSDEGQLALRRGDTVFAARLQERDPKALKRDSKMPQPSENEAVFLEKGPRQTLDDLTFARRARRAPDAGEIEVEILASGLNFRDVLNALGQYPGEAGPLGFESVGRVTQVGAEVPHLSAGDTVIVMAAPGCIGTHATVSAQLVVKKPDGISVADAVSLPATYLTAAYALHHLGKMGPGDKVLIHAAAGGVGLAAVQLAQAAGAEVFATAGAPEKHAFLRQMGVKHIMSSRDTTFAEGFREATGGQGVDMVLNSLSGDFIPASFDLLSDQGRFLEMGKIGIWDNAQVKAAKGDGVYYQAFDLAAVAQEDPALLTGMFQDLLDKIAAGVLQPLPTRVFPMDQAEEAFRFMAQAKHIGKVVLSREADIRSGRFDTTGMVRSDASYLITGGLGALGQRIADWLVTGGATELVLTGRGAPKPDVADQIAIWEEQGVMVHVVAADVGQAADVDRMLAAPTQPLAGVFHAAGVIYDGMIADMDAETLAKTLAPKVQGAWHLHTATERMQLDHFVLFSSFAAILGNLGQAAYAAANAFMDGLALRRQQSGLAATSINWGPWGETGMAAELETDAFSAQGIRPILPAQGMSALEKLLNTGTVRATVADIDWAAYGGFHGMSSTAGLFASLIGDTQDSAGSVQAAEETESIADILADTMPANRPQVLTQYLQTLARQTLGYGEGEVIATDLPLMGQGFDSLMSVDMRNRLGRALKHTLPASLLFDYPTLDRIVEYVLAEVLDLSETAEVEEQSAEDLLDELNALIDT